MKKTGRICGVCGDIGQIEKSAASSVCKTASENRYCVQAPTDQPIWCCQTCTMKRAEMTERRKSDIGGPTKRFENSKVKFLSSKDVITLSNGPIKPRNKTITSSVPPSVQTVPRSGSSTPTPTSKAKNTSESLPSSEKMLFGKLSSSGCKEMGHKLSCSKEQLPYHLAPIVWKGSLEVCDLAGKTLVELVAYLPLQASSKLCSAIEVLPPKLHMKMVPQYNAWPKQLKMDIPNLDDVGVYIRPPERSSSLKWIHLLRQLDSRKHALKMTVNGRLEFVVHSSQVLVENSQKIGGNFFLWGFFWKRKMSDLKKKKPYVIPSKTGSELRANPNFRTPIAHDQRANVLKHNLVDKEANVDITDVRENNLLGKEVVADTFDVSPGLSLPSVGQEPSPMDRQSETSIRGKETQPTDKVVPRSSPISHKADKASDRMKTFSIIGVGSLEATFEACKNMEEYPETPSLADASQIEAECEKEPLTPFTVSLEMPPDFSREVETREKSISNWQHESPPCFDTLGQVLIKQEKEPFDPQPSDLVIPPGFSRKIETREENNISDECKGSSLSRIKEKEAFDPQPGDLEIPPGFSRRMETRVENNISDECKGSSLSRIKALNVPMSVPDNFMDEPLLQNQGIVHQATSFGQRSVVFSYPVVQGTTIPSYNAQPTNPGGQRAIQEVSFCHSQTIPGVSVNQMVARSQNANHCLSAAFPNANARPRTGVPRHFRVFDPSFLGSVTRNAFHPSINEASDITATARGEDSQRETARRSPLSPQENRSRSPPRRRHRSPSMSPVPRRRRSHSRSPVPRRHRNRSRSPVPRRHESRSRSPVPRRHRSRSKSPVPRWHGSPSRSSRWCGWNGNGNGNGSRGRSPVRPCNLQDSGRYSNQYKSNRYRSSLRGDFHSFDYPASRRGRNRSSLSPPTPSS